MPAWVTVGRREQIWKKNNERHNFCSLCFEVNRLVTKHQCETIALMYMFNLNDFWWDNYAIDIFDGELVWPYFFFWSKKFYLCIPQVPKQKILMSFFLSKISLSDQNLSLGQWKNIFGDAFYWFGFKGSNLEKKKILTKVIIFSLYICFGVRQFSINTFSQLGEAQWETKQVCTINQNYRKIMYGYGFSVLKYTSTNGVFLGQ